MVIDPVGDDVLAGWLVTARAAGRPTSAMVSGRRRQRRSGPPTCRRPQLAHAADGAAIPPFRVLLALVSGAGAGTAAARSPPWVTPPAPVCSSAPPAPHPAPRPLKEVPR